MEKTCLATASSLAHGLSVYGKSSATKYMLSWRKSFTLAAALVLHVLKCCMWDLAWSRKAECVTTAVLRM